MPYDFDTLKRLTSESESQQNELYAEMRSNALLVSGNHFTKKGSKFWEGIRQAENLSREQKIRLTNNHIQVVTKTYENNILAIAPDVAFRPKNQNELKDTKAAEFHSSVWQDARERHKLKSFRRSLAKDFIELGEWWAFVTYDPNSGEFLGYEQAIDEFGQPMVDAAGQPVRTNTPRFTGGFVFKRVFGFNVCTDTTAKCPAERKWVRFREMLPVAELKIRYANDPEKLRFVEESEDRTFRVFDGQGWQDQKGLCCVDHFFLKPCQEYPEGYFWYYTETGIIEEGSLPGGLFPIVYCGFDEVATSDRAFSIIKPLRPYQAEINRVAGHIVQTQLSLGWDRVLLRGAGNLSPGGQAHGFKIVKVTGGDYEVIAGRTGDHFLPYLANCVDGLYRVANLAMENLDKPVQADPYSSLFASMKDKKKFILYADKFSESWKELALLHNKLAKIFMPDEQLERIVGAPEACNIAEFRSCDDLSYQVVADEVTDDLESRMGQTLAVNHLLQYIGPNLQPDQIGRIVRMMPYANKEDIFDEATMDQEKAENEILSLDRGQPVQVRLGDNHVYLLKRLTHRTDQPDFVKIDPRVQQLYSETIAAREKAQAQKQMADESLKAGLIPTGGYFVGIDFYVNDPTQPGKTKRARVPFDAIVWLLQRLEAQGISQESMSQLDTSVQAQIQQQAQQMGNTAPGNSPGAGGFQQGMGNQPMSMPDQGGGLM